MIMNRFLLKLIMLMFLSVFLFSGCGWEDDETTDDGTDTVIKPGLIEFVSASSDVIALKGTGNANVPETATLKFKVYGSTGAVLSGTKIDLSLSTDVGGITLSATSATSDANGEISVNVASGTVITVFTVNAVAASNTAVKAASSEIKISSASVKSLQFISADPLMIALKGTGGVDLKETSAVKFRAYDEVGNIVTGALINFALSNTNGGLSLTSNALKTDNNGEVTVNVVSGTIPTSVNIIASLSTDPNMRVISNQIDVSTGRPVKGNFQVGPDKFHAIGAWEVDGISRTVTARAYDRFAHPVPDGTVIGFRAETGGIEPYCTTTDGACSVTWWSSGDRSLMKDADSNGNRYLQYTKGRVTINASVMGEERFIDLNGNGIYDFSIDTWDSSEGDIGELFVNSVGYRQRLAHMSELPAGVNLRSSIEDLLDNNVYKRVWYWENDYTIYTDEFLDDNQNGLRDAGNGILNSKLCTDESQAQGLCSKDLVRIWSENEIIMSPVSPAKNCLISFYDFETGEPSGLVNGKDLVVKITDTNENNLPGGTNIEMSAAREDSTTLKPKVYGNTKTTLPNSKEIGFGTTLFIFSLENAETFTIKVTGEGEDEQTVTYTL